jgi:hypothetical protein
MLKYTREAYLKTGGQTNRQLLAELVNETGLKQLNNFNLDLEARRSNEASKKVRVTIIVENVKD